MKLSALVEHTGKWIGPSATAVGSFARFLREDKKISGGVKGGGAADMTADDKITLLVAVLGCGTARTCASDVKRLLSLVPNADSVPKDFQKEIKFFAQPNLKAALLSLFREIHDGSVERWQKSIVAKGFDVTRLDLVLTFEIDSHFATISLGAAGQYKLGKTPADFKIHFDENFGTKSKGDPPGFSRRIHEVSYERLIGWGACLND